MPMPRDTSVKMSPVWLNFWSFGIRGRLMNGLTSWHQAIVAGSSFRPAPFGIRCLF
jgi:hypothetical protein